MKKFNSIVASASSTNAKALNQIHKDANAKRADITSQANKKIAEIEAKARDAKKKLTAAQERQITNIQDKAAKDRAKITADENKKIASLSAGSAAAKMKALEDYVKKRKDLESLTLDQEAAYWQKAVVLFKNNAKEKTQAQIILNKAMDALNKDRYNKEKAYVEDKKYYNELSLAEELAAYQQYIKGYKAGTEERIYYEKEIYRVKQEIQKQIDQINADYLTKVQTLNQQLIDEEKKLNDEYDKALEDRAKSLYSFVGLFDEITKKSVSGTTLLKNLQDQVSAFEDWQRNLAELAAKGIDQGLLAELQDMGPKAGAEIAALNSLTSDQLTQYVDLWKAKNQLAKEEALKELSSLKVETAQKIEELRADAAVKLLGYQEEWRKAMAGAKFKVKDEAKEMPSIGDYAVAGLISGMMSKKSELVSAAEELASIVKDTFQSALDIHSPSRVFRGFGVNINEGLIKGIQDSSAKLKGVMNNVYGSMASSAGKMLNANNPVTVSSTGQAGSTTTVEHNYYMTFQSPKALDPYETARLNRNALRELAMQV
ncbi:hypothetical protein [Bacillus sp. 1P06AnD]|uniref:hypothetical protein n=1 Tax=Bacillus sp. 1P06AnD TaxID=3132208 RepID=UPI0039A3374B